MDKIDNILNDKEYQSRMKTIITSEYMRKFCRHGLGHALSVARIAYIIALEEHIELDKEIIYGAALLHDIGRYTDLEKEEKMSHHKAGAITAEPILLRCGYDEGDTRLICAAISKHKEKTKEVNTLADILFRADKLSRNCFMCDAKDECYWDESLKNKSIFR